MVNFQQKQAQGTQMPNGPQMVLLWDIIISAEATVSAGWYLIAQWLWCTSSSRMWESRTSMKEGCHVAEIMVSPSLFATEDHMQSWLMGDCCGSIGKQSYLTGDRFVSVDQAKIVHSNLRCFYWSSNRDSWAIALLRLIKQSWLRGVVLFL